MCVEYPERHEVGWEIQSRRGCEKDCWTEEATDVVLFSEISGRFSPVCDGGNKEMRMSDGRSQGRAGKIGQNHNKKTLAS